MDDALYLKIQLKFIEALVLVANKDVKVLSCSNMNFCLTYNREVLLTSRGCPLYCEVIVAAKDYAFKRRRPKAKVEEIKANSIKIDSL
mgnify:CR=1 FL=1